VQAKKYIFRIGDFIRQQNAAKYGDRFWEIVSNMTLHKKGKEFKNIYLDLCAKAT